VSFGRGGVVAAEVCAPQSDISLGHNNILIGSFVSDTVHADLNNFGRCCGMLRPVPADHRGARRPGDGDRELQRGVG
jgi:hypothetical protein